MLTCSGEEFPLANVQPTRRAEAPLDVLDVLTASALAFHSAEYIAVMLSRFGATNKLVKFYTVACGASGTPWRGFTRGLVAFMPLRAPVQFFQLVTPINQPDIEPVELDAEQDVGEA